MPRCCFALFATAKKQGQAMIHQGGSIRGTEKLRSIHLLLYKYKRRHYRDPLSLAPPLFANLFVILLSFVIQSSPRKREIKNKRKKQQQEFFISLFGDHILFILYVCAISKKYLKTKRKTLFGLRFFHLSQGEEKGKRGRKQERKNKERTIHSQDKQ